MTLIFETIHGSHLYGMAHAESDRDMYYVYDDRRKARQKVGEEDAVRVGLDDFMRKAYSGSHQSLEALFSPVKVWHDERYKEFIEGTYVPAAEVREKYMRTIKSFTHAEGPDGFKRRRHGLRLALNLHELTNWGRFNPRLSELTVDTITAVARELEGERLYNVARAITET